MARGRGKSTIACVLGMIVVGVLLGGCGAKEHANDPRPASPTQITVSISQRKVSLAPSTVGVESVKRQAQAQQQGVNNDQPLLVALTIANLTNFDSHLEIAGPKDSTSPLVVANGTASYKAFLPTGDYLVSAADIPGAIAARLSVGPDRTSSDNDLLLP
jgi:hypothetical protein